MNRVVPDVPDVPIIALKVFDSIEVPAFYVRYILFQHYRWYLINPTR
jgi:hypothetical protein